MKRRIASSRLGGALCLAVALAALGARPARSQEAGAAVSADGNVPGKTLFSLAQAMKMGPAGSLAVPPAGFVSSSTGEGATEAGESLEGQPPPRRRYGRPNYHDRMHNSDGSGKLAASLGVGLTSPTGTTKDFLTLSYHLQASGGLNFNRTFGVLLQFDYDHFGVTKSELAKQKAFYSGITDSTGNRLDVRGLDANAHILGFSVNPVVNFYTSDTVGAYVIGGVGFYHKAVNFTLPMSTCFFDQFGQCFPTQVDQNFDTNTSNGVGYNGGAGFTYKTSKFATQRLFAEVRYVYVRSTPNTQPQTLDNSYPPATFRSSYIPVTVGFRF